MFPWHDPEEPMRFDHFMAAALHDPERGYYGRRIRSVGHQGDFSTSASLSSALGRAIARWAGDAMKSSSCRNLVELGPGTGELTETVLQSLPWLQRRRTTVHLIETSAPLREIQASRLGSRVQWHSSLDEALETCDGAACLYSNEFVDAFPVRRFRYADRGWSEQFVTPNQSHWKPVDDLPESTAFTRPWPERQVVEVHQSYHRWLDENLARWRRGRMLTIDYGSPVEDLYHRQPTGSLRAYLHHQLVTGDQILSHPGHQDITADVNFSDLIAWTTSATEVRACLPQSEFLGQHIHSGDPADQFLARPDGAGGAFMVLDQESS